MSKTCSKCKIEKSMDMFGKDIKTKDGKFWCCRECVKKKNKKYLNSKVGKHIAYFHNAKKRGYSFDLTVEEVFKITSDNCKYCGEEKCGGIDRVYNNEGYKLGNIVPCCGTCNSMKGVLGYVGFINHIKKIAKRHSLEY